MNESETLWNEEKILQQMEQQQDELEEKDQKIQDLLLIKQELVSTLQIQSRKIADQSETIRLLNEQIGMMSESDQQLQSALALKKQSEERSRLAMTAQHTAETAALNYEKKKREAEALIANTKKEIDKAAEEKIERQRYLLQKKSTAKIQYYANEYDRRFNKYKTFLLALFLYSLTATIMEIATTEECIRHFEMFIINVYDCLSFFADRAMMVVNFTTGIDGFGGWLLDGIFILIGLLLIAAVLAIICLVIPYTIAHIYYRTIINAEKTIYHDIGITIAVMSFVILIWTCDIIPKNYGLSIIWIWIIIQVITVIGINYYNDKFN